MDEIKKKISTRDKLEEMKELIKLTEKEEIVDTDEEEKDKKMAINMMFGFIKALTQKSIDLMQSIEDPIDSKRKMIVEKQRIIFNSLNDLYKSIKAISKEQNKDNEEY